MDKFEAYFFHFKREMLGVTTGGYPGMPGYKPGNAPGSYRPAMGTWQNIFRAVIDGGAAPYRGAVGDMYASIDYSIDAPL